MPHPFGLYYPFIHFRDERWLKLVALYWPKLARIVPSGYPTHDSETVKRLNGELSFVIDLDPGWSVGEVGDSFAQLLVEHAGALQERYGVSKRQEWKPDPATMAYAPPERAMAAPSLAHVYAPKIHPDLLPALLETGLVVPAGKYGRWMGMHPRLADVYMSALADHLADVNALRPVTDKVLDHLAVGGWDMPHLAQALLGKPLAPAPATEGTDLAKALGMLAIEAVIPEGLDQVPVERIIKIRKEHGDEFDAFRTYVDELAAGLASLNVQSPKIVQGYLEEGYNTKLAPKLKELRSRLKWLKVETTTSVANVQTTLPPLLLSTAGLAGFTINPIIGLGGAVAFGLLPIFGAYRERVNELTSGSPAAYLLRVEKELRPPTLVQRLTEGGRRFLGA